MYRILFVLFVGLSIIGCTHTQLRHSTLGQVRTLADINHQQVLDNVAMFCCSSSAMPFFAIPKSGLTQVNDLGEATGGLKWQLQLVEETLGLKGSRSIQENWQLEPINDPAKLHRMRCIYQWAACGMMPCNECENCFADLDKMYPTQLNEDGTVKKLGKECRVPPAGWFTSGKRRDVPKDACYVSHFGDHYVWVCGDGLDSLTKLTLTILDLATNVPNNPKQEVTRYWRVKGDKFELDRVETKGSERQKEYDEIEEFDPNAMDDMNPKKVKKPKERYVPSEKVRDFNLNSQSLPFAIPQSTP